MSDTQIIEGVRVRREGYDWTVGPWRFCFDEHDCNYVLRGPDRRPEGFGSVSSGVRALIGEGRLHPFERFVDRAGVDLLVEEFERGLQQLVICGKDAEGCENAIVIATRRYEETLRKAALKYRYAGYGTTDTN